MLQCPCVDTVSLERDLHDLGKRLVVKRTFLQVETDPVVQDELPMARRRKGRALTEPCKIKDSSLGACNQEASASNNPCSDDECTKAELQKHGNSNETHEFLTTLRANLFKNPSSKTKKCGAPPLEVQPDVARLARTEQAVDSVHRESSPQAVEEVVTDIADNKNDHACTAQTGAAKLEEKSRHDRRTTLMLRNIPNDYTRDMFLDLLDSQGFRCCYDFVYLPIDVTRRAGLGYAFVNCVTPLAAQQMRKQFQGYQDWSIPSQKVCEACWGEPLQGLRAHTERFRNSPLMHKTVPDECRPICLENGVRVTFPSPTKRIRAPKKSDLPR